MEFRLLGPLEVRDGEALVAVGGGKRRSLLALLLLHPAEVVPAERLIDELWSGRPPPTAAKSLQVHMSQLRRDLARADGGRNGGVLVTRGNGYVATVDPADVDVHRFERLAAEGRRVLRAGELAAASERLRAALALWRGPALLDFAYEAFAQGDIARLEEERLEVLEDCADAELALGRHGELVGELQALVRAHPYRERPRAQLMLALYRGGRQADALQAYREGRAELASELGLEPGPSLRELEGRILIHDPALQLTQPAADAPTPSKLAARPGEAAVDAAPPPETTRPTDRAAAPGAPARAAPGGGRAGRAARRAVPAAVALLLVVVAARALWPEPAVHRAAAPSSFDLARDSIAGIDGDSGAVRLAVPLPGRPTDLAAAGSMLFATTVDSASLTEVDARTRTIVRTIPLGMSPAAVAVGAGAVWIADGRRGRLVSVRIGYDRLSRAVRLERAPPVPDAVSVAVGRGAVWATDGSAVLARLDPRTRRVTGVRTGLPLRAVTVGPDGVWAISARPPTVLRVDPRTNAVAGRVGLGRAGDASPFPAAVTATKDAVWVLSRNTATVTRIDTASLAVAAVIPIGAERVPNDIAAGAETVWVANDDGTLTRIDATTNSISAVRVGTPLRGVAVNGAQLWAAATALDQQLAGGAG